jgi:hypothetical protein
MEEQLEDRSNGSGISQTRALAELCSLWNLWDISAPFILFLW